MTIRRAGICLLSAVCLFSAVSAFADDAERPVENPPPKKTRHERRAPQKLEADIVSVMDALKASNPEEYGRLKKLQQENRAEFLREIRKHLPRKPFFSHDVMRLERQCVELARQYRRARTNEERAVIRKELDQSVQMATDALIADLKQRVVKMEAHIKEMEDGREDIIRRRIDILLQAPEEPRQGGHFRNGFTMPPMPPMNKPPRTAEQPQPPPPETK